MADFTIGVLGGMGTYASIHLFKQYADTFPAEKEWERPRIIIDNRCTMPSRVRAFLYNENVEQLLSEMTDSMKMLSDSGCTRIILACNTSHLFLPEIYRRAPELEGKVINIIRHCVKTIADKNIHSVYILGSEGTIESGIYQKESEQYGIECIVPDSEDYALLRTCIEAVKQNKYDADIKIIFTEFCRRHENCILGCTELPILYEMYKDDIDCNTVFDPLLLALQALKNEYDNMS